MMIIHTINNGVPCVSLGIEDYLVHYVNSYGQIISLDQWAREWGITPWWVRRCAHRACQQGRLQLTRLVNTSGRPYRVSALEEANHEN